MDALLNEHQVSELIGFKVSTLRKRRHLGMPPRFLKMGTKIMYDPNDIQEYLKSCVRESTSNKEAR